jgi:PTH1 family peptidyl-tRNA hydrolase
VDSEEQNTRRFVVGLGNPGRKYADTRHNVGFRVLEVLQRRWGLGEGRDAFEGLFWETRPERPDAGSRRVALLAPMTYMNCSGRAARKMLDFYKAAPSQMLVVLDDLALPLGQLRLRPGGSAGGHNGLDDILRVCRPEEPPRLRIGIGAPPGVMDPRDYVLSVFREEEREEIGVSIEQAADAVEMWVFGDLQKAMETYNRKRET